MLPLARMRRGAPPPSEDPVITELRGKHKLDLQNLTLSKKPFKTLQLFLLATVLYLKRLFLYVLRKGGWFNVFTILVAVLILLLLVIDGPHEQHVQESLNYVGFGLWWVGLGVASSIGLGFGLHTFVLYLGPHIALFTIKAVQCGRVDLKTALYDTIQLKRRPSWFEKDCSEFGPPVYPLSASSLVRIPLIKLLPQVQIESVLWGIGTALGELPPYFISRAARLSGSKLEIIDDELDGDPSQGDGLISSILNKSKRWLLSHSQHLNAFTILLLASVPNPLFDLAGIMCGQFGIPFWKFFIATLIGKAVIKTYIQTVFIITLCNNQLLEWAENELIWLFGHIPIFSSLVPTLITKLHLVKEKLSSPVPASDSPAGQGKQWSLSFPLVWNTVVWVMITAFFVKMVTETAQRYLKKQQDLELSNKLSSLEYFSANASSTTEVND